MRLLLISPTHYLRDGSLLTTTPYWTSGLTLPSLKALTPAGWEVRLIEELVEFAARPPRVWHHHWTAGDAIVWDNRCLMHRACPWDMREPRVMQHSRIAGDPASESALAA